MTNHYVSNEGGKSLEKIMKTSIIIVVSLVVIALLAHLTMNYLVPIIVEMHSAGAY